jgi:hypothetical protein
MEKKMIGWKYKTIVCFHISHEINKNGREIGGKAKSFKYLGFNHIRENFISWNKINFVKYD